MANPYINIYKDNPIEGAKDGTPVSTDGTYTAPIEAVLVKGTTETQVIKLAVRTEEGYKTLNDFNMYVASVNLSHTLENDTAPTSKKLFIPKNDIYDYFGTDNILLSWTLDGNFSRVIMTTEEIGSTNKIFYAKFSMSSNEQPQTDKSMKFVVETSIVTVN